MIEPSAPIAFFIRGADEEFEQRLRGFLAALNIREKSAEAHEFYEDIVYVEKYRQGDDPHLLVVTFSPLSSELKHLIQGFFTDYQIVFQRGRTEDFELEAR